MTVKDVIEQVEKLRPGSNLSFEEYIHHLNCLESDIYSNIASGFENAKEMKSPEKREDDLLVPSMYASLYCHYIAAQIDIGNGDVTRYSNNMILYNALLSAYSDWCIRNYMPRQKGKVRWR